MDPLIYPVQFLGVRRNRKLLKEGKNMLKIMLRALLLQFGSSKTTLVLSLADQTTQSGK